MKFILTLIVFFTFNLFADEAPFFPEVDQSFSFDPGSNNGIAFVFNSKGKTASSNVDVSVLHQNREWDYNWIVLGFSMKAPSGTFGIGYSNYGTQDIPVTKDDGVYGPFISSYKSDMFETFSVAYSPFNKWVNFTALFNFKKRTLIDEVGSGIYLDAAISSPYVLNNQLGLKTTNIVGTNYAWSGINETLPKFISLYYFYPFYDLTLMLENNFCLNYSDLSLLTAGASLQVDKLIRVFFSYQSSTILTAISFGADISISNQLSLNYTSRVEENDYDQLDIHSIGIGVKF